MEDASVEVKPNTSLAKAWKFPAFLRNFSLSFDQTFLFFLSVSYDGTFLSPLIKGGRGVVKRKVWAEEKRLRSMMFMKLTWEENYVICSISLSIQHHTP
jgi:hypothetical protein